MPVAQRPNFPWHPRAEADGRSERPGTSSQVPNHRETSGVARRDSVRARNCTMASSDSGPDSAVQGRLRLAVDGSSQAAVMTMMWRPLAGHGRTGIYRRVLNCANRNAAKPSPMTACHNHGRAFLLPASNWRPSSESSPASRLGGKHHGAPTRRRCGARVRLKQNAFACGTSAAESFTE